VAWYRRRKQLAKAQKAIAAAKITDPSWDTVMTDANNIFYQFQQDWSNFNVENMRNYLTDSYFQHIYLMMRALYEMGRQNRMSHLSIVSSTLFSVDDRLDDERDTFDVEINARAYDELIDTATGQKLYTENSLFTEVWHFDREGGQWKLDNIYQADVETIIQKGYVDKEARRSKNAQAQKMRAFAMQHNFFYNADFGWLLLPRRGLLFSEASFGRSDINFHVLGEYRNVLVQFYQYYPLTPDKLKPTDYVKHFFSQTSPTAAYTIAQTTLPRSYGNIIVKRKSRFGLSFTPRGMTKVSLEGVSFDRSYDVFATDMERVASLELLHPAYMEQLLGVSFQVNIEIVDDVLYLYSTDSRADFEVMLQLLQAAFEAMKM